ncbi:MAG: zinc ribbon domain-containing protein, partial [[Clostridium] leptum]
MFSGIVRCADCGEKLYYCTSRNFEARQDHFVCSTSRLKGKEVCPTHFIRAVVLEQGVLAHMRMTIACVANHEEQFRKAMGAKQKAEAKRELAA